MKHNFDWNREELRNRFDRCAKAATARLIALLVGYGCLEDDLADLMDDIPPILTRTLGSLRDEIESGLESFVTDVAEATGMVELTVTLDGFDPAKKIPVIKAVREITGLGLKEAMDLVKGAPKPVKENVSKEEAEAIMKALAEAGGKVSAA